MHPEDSELVGTVRGKKYTAEVRLPYEPWDTLCFDYPYVSSKSTYVKSARRAIYLATGGKYSTCGAYGSKTYYASRKAAKAYLKKNILMRIRAR